LEQDWRIGKSAEESKLNNWQSIEHPSLANFQRCQALGFALLGAHALLKDPNVEINLKPKGVVSCQAYKKGKLKLIPSSNKIYVLQEDQKPVASSIVKDGLVIAPFFAKNNSCCVPAWFLCTTADPSNANMELQWLKAETVATLGKATCSSDVLIPVFINTADVVAGEELLVHEEEKSPVTAQKRKLGPIALNSPTSKKMLRK